MLTGKVNYIDHWTDILSSITQLFAFYQRKSEEIGHWRIVLRFPFREGNNLTL